MKFIMKLLSVVLIGFIVTIFIGCTLNSGGNDTSSAISFDVRDIPFSYNGSELALGYSLESVTGNRVLALTDVTGNSDFGKGQLFSLELLTNTPDSLIKTTAILEMISFSSDGKVYATGCFESAQTFRLRGTGLPMRLSFNKGLITDERLTISPVSSNTFHIQVDFKFGTSRYILTCLNGSTSYNEGDEIRLIPGESDSYEVAIEETDSTWHSDGYFKSFDQCVSESRIAFNNGWLKCHLYLQCMKSPKH